MIADGAKGQFPGHAHPVKEMHCGILYSYSLALIAR